MPEQPFFGLTGLAVMGQNLARNVAHHGFPIVVHNRTTEKTDAFLKDHGGEGAITGAHDPASFVAALQTPRAIMIMVKAGQPVDDVIAELTPHMAKGDVLIDGGNSHFTDTQRRADALGKEGFLFLGTGVSGGEEGALDGPSLMPGGAKEGYDRVAPIFNAIAAQVNGEACCTYIGEGAAGHYVKMVHNGIEYADMQLIAESYDLLKHVVGLSNEEIAGVFEQWNEGDLDSYLIQITARIFRVKDGETGRDLVDVVKDEAEQKGTGRWVAQSALDLGLPISTITEAVFARSLSAMKDARVRASKELPSSASSPDVDRDEFIRDVRDALYASKVVAYTQGFEQMAGAAKAFGWTLNLAEIAKIWRGGCIIRARFLDRIFDAFTDDPSLPSLLFHPYFKDAVTQGQHGWRHVVSVGARLGIPLPAFSSALAYYDGYRRERLPANLIQAQRDLFGAHTYQRTDKEGIFHSAWEPGA